ncbi:hypothetical protein [Mycobacteroides abscessus]|uniref:hypothetical protein n=1 Tax=Mycobacteroides abscessus TaxID=36809 RepID=UPI0009A688D4|nr:hypothetical protein [Mycobacteroides abscessus]RIT44612.1 hypothetical protein D2E80_19780 [Mycobacteroides abscessus]SKT79098.1 Uncharacterised protein [Mycobacteroides abscessus subsp. massiliense]SKU02791.1 Uncharacterised protein [Mycobacteroides abscessus subsp. massiliense]
MTLALQITGIAVIGVGVLLVLFGVGFAWGEFQANRKLDGGATEFVKALTALVKALAKQPRSVVCFTFGTLLIFLGGLISGVTGLVG